MSEEITHNNCHNITNKLKCSKMEVSILKKVKAFIFTALLVVGFSSVASAASAASAGVTTVSASVEANNYIVCTMPCKKEM